MVKRNNFFVTFLVRVIRILTLLGGRECEGRSHWSRENGIKY
jgi:hypothetical protein